MADGGEPVARFIKSSSRKPTTGLIALFFTLRICDTLHLYGFDAGNADERYHYFSTRKKRKSAHSFDREGSIIRAMAGANLLVLHQ